MIARMFDDLDVDNDGKLVRKKDLFVNVMSMGGSNAVLCYVSRCHIMYTYFGYSHLRSTNCRL